MRTLLNGLGIEVASNVCRLVHASNKITSSSVLSPFSRRRRYHHFAAIFSSEEDDLEFVQIRYLVLARRWIQEVALSVRKDQSLKIDASNTSGQKIANVIRRAASEVDARKSFAAVMLQSLSFST